MNGVIIMTIDEPIAAACPYDAHYVDVLDAKMHYLDEGDGDPILFLHGMPASNYIWRNVIPCLKDQGRCIAPDFIGTGKSDKPDISYRIFDHIRYIEKFVETLKLKNITLVVQGWGSMVGFDYAMKHEKNVKGIVFLESHVRPEIKFSELALPVQELLLGVKSFDHGVNAIMDSDTFVETFLRMGTLRRLTPEELEEYMKAYQHKRSYQPLIQYLIDYPYEHGPEDVLNLIGDYSKKLQQSALPKLMLYAMPGFNTTMQTLSWAKTHLKNLVIEELGDGLHFLQETQPAELGKKIAKWLTDITTDNQKLPNSG